MAELNTAPVEMDGSLHDAALALQGIADDGIGDPSPGMTQTPANLVHPADQGRSPNGQFRSQKGPPPVADIVNGVEKAPPQLLKPGEIAQTDEVDADAAEASDPADEYFELPAEKEGGQPVRMKATEVWEQAQRARVLEQQLAEARKEYVPPETYDAQLIDLINAQANTMRNLSMYEQMLRPEQPDLELINEESPRYNPGLYQRQMAIAQQKYGQVQRIQQEMQAIQQDQHQRQAALSRNQRLRCAQEVQKFWPEVIGPNADKEAEKVRSAISENYGHLGFTPEVLATITNPGAFLVLKHALAWVNSQKAQQAAVKVVRAKPKLVRGAARSTNSPQQAAYQAGMQRLTTDHSVEAAAAAMAGLI